MDCSGVELRRVSDSEHEAINAVGYHVAKQHTCMISQEGKHPNPIGSGSFVRVDSKLFVATAKHLFEKFDSDSFVGIYWGEKDDRVFAKVDSIVRDEVLDIAAIPLPPDTPVSGWPLKSTGRVGADLFVVSGIPTQKCHIDHQAKSLYVGHFSLGCAVTFPE